MDFAQIIQTVAIYAIPVLFAITVHEAAHGYAARHFGDNTAWSQGRVTLNPIKHIDPIGTLLMPPVKTSFSPASFSKALLTSTSGRSGGSGAAAVVKVHT